MNPSHPVATLSRPARARRASRSAAILLACAVLDTPARGQQALPVAPHPWAVRLGGTGNDVIGSIASRSDKGCFLAGGSASFGGLWSDFWIASLDRGGRTMWELALGGSFVDSVGAVLATPDGGCLAAGFSLASSGAKSDGWVVKLDEAGSVTWQKLYGSTGSESISAVALSPDGYYLGATIDGGATGSDPCVLEIDADGNILWQVRLPAPGADGLASITATDDGVVLVATSDSAFPGSPGVADFRPWVVSLDGDGNSLWQKTYNYSGGDRWNEIVALEEGGFIAVGEILWGNFLGGDVWIVRLDPSGAVRWDRRLGDNFGIPGRDTGQAVRPTAGGGFAVLAGSDTTQDDLWLIQLDAEGARQWDRSYGPAGAISMAFDRVPKGDLLLAGVIVDPPGSPSSHTDSLVLRLTPGGRGPACDLPVHGTEPREWTGVLTVAAVSLDPIPAQLVATSTAEVPIPADTATFVCAPLPTK